MVLFTINQHDINIQESKGVEVITLYLVIKSMRKQN